MIEHHPKNFGPSASFKIKIPASTKARDTKINFMALMGDL
jgi:hypothetical protein